MTEFSVCAVVNVPEGNVEYPTLVCGEFKEDPLEAYKNFRQVIDQFITDKNAYYTCGEYAIRFVARVDGSRLFGTGTTPEEALSDTSRVYKDSIGTGFFDSLRFDAKLGLAKYLYKEGAGVPAGMANGFFNPPLCSLPKEEAKLFGWEANEESSETPKIIADEIVYEACSEDPCSLNPCYIDEPCKDVDFYIQNGMFVPPPSDLADEHAEEARLERMFANPPWEGCED